MYNEPRHMDGLGHILAHKAERIGERARAQAPKDLPAFFIRERARLRGFHGSSRNILRVAHGLSDHGGAGVLDEGVTRVVLLAD